MSEEEIGVDVVIEDEEGSVEIKSDVLKGDKGEKGDPTATIEINQVITGEAGTNAKIENVGTDVNLKLDITIPQGDKGEQGETGADGYIPIKGTDYFTEAEIQQIKSDILADVSSFDLEVVTTLPTENIKEKTIYLVPNSKQAEKNIYDECIYVNNDWEYIGTTEVDLSNYYNRTEIDEKTNNLKPNKYILIITETTETGAEITLPCYYKVGQDVLDVYLEGERLLLSSDEAGTDGHYVEVGEADSISNKIKITSDWAVEAGMTFEFVVRGEYSN